MKKHPTTLAVLAFTCIFLFQCGGNTETTENTAKDDTEAQSESDGARFDDATELQTGIQGLTVGKISIIDGNDKRLTNSEVALNTEFSVVYEGIENYTLKDGKAFPDLSILVIDDNQNPVLSKTDLLAAGYPDGLSEEDASILRATVIVGDPIKPGKYICSIRVTDKNNTEASILSTWSFEVK